MRGSPEYQDKVEAYRAQLRGYICGFAECVAGPLPRTHVNRNGCWLKAYVNYGESDFENIGRVYTKCTTQSHKHHPIAYISATLSNEMMMKLYHLCALYKMSGWKYSSSLTQFSTEGQHLAVLSRLLNEASKLCQEHVTQDSDDVSNRRSPSRIKPSTHTLSSAPTTPPASPSIVTMTPSPMATVPLPVLGKRKRETSSDGRKGKLKRRAIRTFPCLSPLQVPVYQLHVISDEE
ncbi:hypothetical protein Moror_9554 [Moniliophthora roreri MCA 2997]|uniref:Uncharacterized protein n=1 Tax=Moniliophthora roreri (strain MCA 2997) TaxID=1381753 RepID=V2XEA1_MONRO|nr:hypothetical protein Moror_9554 [Moniliophthora roreri MCA 2997]